MRKRKNTQRSGRGCAFEKRPNPHFPPSMHRHLFSRACSIFSAAQDRLLLYSSWFLFVVYTVVILLDTTIVPSN
jgi:hypothetical protein